MSQRISFLVWLCLALAAAACAEEKPVWQIGLFDHSSNEFRSQRINYKDPKDDPVYRVGQSRDSDDWQRFQAGPANGMAGGREHPFTILFHLPDAPSGVYHLKIAMLYQTPRLSYLKLDVNGHSGAFYFHPRLDYHAGDWEGTFVPQTSADEKTIAIPATFFERGENKLVLTALDDPTTVENSLGSIATGHTGLVYDALALTQALDSTYDPDAIQAEIVPTIFYRDGREVVEAYLDFASIPREAETQLIVGGRTLEQKLNSSQAFGEQRVVFEVPEWTGTAKAELKVGSGGKSRTFPLQLTAGKKWTLYLVPHEHLDVGFTDYPEKVAEFHSESVDGVLEILKKVPDFRWTLDGYWVADKYQEGRSPEKQREFIQALKDGKIVLPPQYANQHTGTASLEGLFRSLYDSHAFAAKYGITPGAAHITDVPSYSWSYASVLANAGTKYFVAASNNWRAPVLLHGRWNERSPFYWEGPDGGRVLMWYSRAYLQMATLFATPPRVAAIRDSLPVFLQAYSHPGYKASAAIIFGSQLENTPLSPEQATIVAEWNGQYAWPRLEFSTFKDAMASIEKQFDGSIATYRGDFGPYWEDGFGSDASSTAIHRQNQQRILCAEKLGSIPATLSAALRPEQTLLQRAWTNSLMFDEHTWTYVGATAQPEHEQTLRQLQLKQSRATGAKDEIDESLHRSWAQLESFLGPKDASVAVFNSLNWPRSGEVTFDLQDGTGVFDSNGHPVVVETLWVGKHKPLPGFGGGYRRVRFLAADVPAVGYKLYALRATKPVEAAARVLPGPTFENQFYRVTVGADSGALESVWDKALGRELVDRSSPFRFGGYVYVTGGDDMPNNSLYRYGASLKPPRLTPATSSQGRLVEAKETPLGIRIVLESSAPHTPEIRTEILLCPDQKRIDFTYSLHKDFVLDKEAAYVAFPFAAENPAFAYETQNGWVDPARDELAGGSREWYAVQHWAAVRSPEWSAAIVPQDAPLVAFGDIVRGNWPTGFHPRSGAIFSWLMNNYWGTNFAPGQGGDYKFRYTLVSGPGFDPSALTHAGWEEMTALESDQLGATFSPGVLPGDQASLLEAMSPNIVLVTWKTAQDGEGTILRLEEIAGKDGSIRLASRFFKIVKAWRCTGLEDKQAELTTGGGGVEVALRPFEVATVRITTQSQITP
ncbi:MAG TPA: polysaccharide lyase family protein [Terriglobales bacterium]|nr:polysaccharide lyase family protein [Terriglobales bacterium]